MNSDGIHKYFKISNIKFKRTPAGIIFWGFVILVLMGSLLLSLPISSNSGNHTSFINALFTATSSVCVTGLIVVDTNTYWSTFGKVVILLLIQVGALGIMALVTLLSVITGKKLDFSHRMAIKESISSFSLENILVLFRRILKFTIIIEGIGTIVTSIDLIPRYGLIVGIGKSIFHSISSFCNAGFDVFGTNKDQFTSLTRYDHDVSMLLTTAFLIIIGGLGFIVWDEIANIRRFSRFTLHTKIVLIMTLILICSGTLSFAIFEKAYTMRGLPLPIKILNSFFQSATSRTAGFNAISINEMNPVSIFITILLMFIGAAPGSTAGGIKVTTLFVLSITVISFLKGQSDVQVFKRRITSDIILKAISIFILSLFLIMITTIVLLINKEGSLLQTLFEAVSAFGTVGLSTGITPDLNDISKFQLIITMFLGRVGIITSFAAFASRSTKDDVAYKYPKGNITVG